MFAFHAVMHKRKMGFVYCFASKQLLPYRPPLLEEFFFLEIITALKTSDNRDETKFPHTQLLLYSKVHKHLPYNNLGRFFNR